ncbi:MAG: diguanylate cyclase [Pseudomonadota bacterium]
MAGKVLIVDTSPQRRALLAQALGAGFLSTDEISCFETARARAEASHPSVIFIDCHGNAEAGIALCKALKADLDAPYVPVILMVHGADHDNRIAGLQAGADDLLISPYDPRVLLSRVRSLMRLKAMRDELAMRQATARELGLQDDHGTPGGAAPLFSHSDKALEDHAPPADGFALTARAAQILLVVRDKVAGECLGTELAKSVDAEFTIATTGFGALRATETLALDAIMVAEDKPDARGFAEAEDPVQLIAAITSRSDARHTPILFLAQEASGTDHMASALDAGAADCALLADPGEELAARLSAQLRRKHYSDHLRASLDDGLRLAVTDELTGLPGRRYLSQHMERLFARARRDGQPLSALMIDLDRFKAINDRYGHDAGDAALVEFARRLKAEVRGGDLVARYGGEEFLVITTDATGQSAEFVAERVRRAVADMPISLDDQTEMILTVSIGVASLDDSDRTPADLITRADKALGEAKRNGRNRIYIAAA